MKNGLPGRVACLIILRAVVCSCPELSYGPLLTGAIALPQALHQISRPERDLALGSVFPCELVPELGHTCEALGENPHAVDRFRVKALSTYPKLSPKQVETDHR